MIDQLVEKIKKTKAPGVVGLDPMLSYIPEWILKDAISKYGETMEAAGEAIWVYNKGIVDAVYDLIPAVKPQIAMYEQFGIPGLVAFQKTVNYCKEKGLVVIGDVKPFVDVCKEEKKGIFVLVKTSNPSSGEFQDKLIDGKPLYELVGEHVAKWGEDCVGSCGYSEVGAVVGATYPEMGKVLRNIMPKSYILVPGYGAQGGTADSLRPYFNEDGLGAIVNSSRGIICAYKQEKYASFGEKNYADASRQAVIDMIEDINRIF